LLGEKLSANEKRLCPSGKTVTFNERILTNARYDSCKRKKFHSQFSAEGGWGFTIAESFSLQWKNTNPQRPLCLCGDKISVSG
jgi:hypothetical protein